MNRHEIRQLVIFLAIFATTAVRAEVMTEQVVRIGSDIVVDDDLYVVAESITIDGTVKGDLYAAGRQITVNGHVEGDFVSAAQTIDINGRVGDDVRVAGQFLRLGEQAHIGDDLIAAGYGLNSAASSRVEGELRYAGFSADLAGTVNKRTTLTSDRCILSGQFGNDLEITINGSNWGTAQTPGLVVAEGTQISGQLRYDSAAEATIAPSAEIAGGVNFSKAERDSLSSNHATESYVVAFAQRFAALLLVGGLLVLCCRGWTRCVVERLQNRTLISFVWGVVSFLVLPVIVILGGIITVFVAVLLGLVRLENLIPATLGVGGLGLSSLAVFFCLFASWIATVLVGCWAGNRLVYGTRWNDNQAFVPMIVGVAIVSALSVVPYVGGLTALAVSILGVGGAALWLKEKIQLWRQAI